MKVAISSSGKDLDSQIDPRFGRCAYFIICDTDSMEFEVFDNESISLGGGAGIQSAQFIASKGAKAVITGDCGPNAVRTLEAAGVTMFTGQSGTVREAVERVKNNELQSSKQANVPDHYGMQDSSPQSDNSGMGMGMGGGRGMGRGMGMGGGKGMGRGMGMGGGNQFNNTTQSGVTRDQELNLLKKQSEDLLKQVSEIQARIGKLEK